MATRRGAVAPAPSAAGRPKLSLEQVVDAALELVDAEGLDGLTIRRLAVALGVTPMALYWHVADKDALLQAIGERLWRDVEVPEPQADFAADIAGLADAIVRALRPHPAAAPLAMPTVLACEPGLVVSERVLRRLVDAGLSDLDAANAGANLLCSIVTLVTAQPGGSVFNGFDPETRAQMIARKQEHIAGLPAEDYRTVKRLAEHLTSPEESDAYLALGVDLLVRGICSLVEEAQQAATGQAGSGLVRRPARRATRPRTR